MGDTWGYTYTSWAEKKKQLLSGTPKLIRFWDHDAQPREFRDPLRLGMG
jgi:hypothetical protein